MTINVIDAFQIYMLAAILTAVIQNTKIASIIIFAGIITAFIIAEIFS